MALSKKIVKFFLIILLSLLILAGLFFTGIFYFKSLNDDLKSGENIPSAPSELFNPQLLSLRSQLETADDPRLGPDDAPITIVQFMDFRCPVCAEAFPVLRELSYLYKDKVKFILRDYPLKAEESLNFALAGNCALEQKKFWPFHDKMFQYKDKITLENLSQYTEQAGLNKENFSACLNSERYKKEVYDDIADAQALGVKGTPTWFINGYKFEGAVPLEQFKEIIGGVLERMETGSK
ncbi:MAG: DsbA family protein [Patescibacteria group bacterium]|nr:DsbA family protein [Patescibacteria group bacterium]MDD5490989.1 DsbA family protein [Patescibacteria group bacterium]